MRYWEITRVEGLFEGEGMVKRKGEGGGGG